MFSGVSWCRLGVFSQYPKMRCAMVHLMDGNGACRHRWHCNFDFSSTPWSPGLRGGAQSHRVPLLLHTVFLLLCLESKMHWDHGINNCVFAIHVIQQKYNLNLAKIHFLWEKWTSKDFITIYPTLQLLLYLCVFACLLACFLVCLDTGLPTQPWMVLNSTGLEWQGIPPCLVYHPYLFANVFIWFGEKTYWS